MFDAVRHGPSRYTEAERAAWVPHAPAGDYWDERLAGQALLVAERAGEMLGFMTLAPAGYIDFAFIRPAAQGSGLFRRLYEQVEARARADGEPRLWAHASRMAAPVLGAMGWTIVRREEVGIADQSLERFEMEKRLAQSAG